MRVCVQQLVLVAMQLLAVRESSCSSSQQHEEPLNQRRARQTLIGSASGSCPDVELFNYLLYYYLIQAQSSQTQHLRADQMASALLRLRTARGTDPVPTLISTNDGQAALLAMLQNVAQNNPSRLLALLGSVQPQQRPPAPTVAAYSTGYPPQSFRPQLTGDGVLDNRLHFSPSLRKQVYAPQPLSPDAPRTVIRAPSTRLQVSTITLVTSIVNTRTSVVPLLFNGQPTTTQLVETSTHLVTATRLQTLAVVVTPTVVEAYGRTTTLYGHEATTNAEIITDLSFSDDDAHFSQLVHPTPTGPLVPPTTVVVSPPELVQPATPSRVQQPVYSTLPPPGFALPSEQPPSSENLLRTAPPSSETPLQTTPPETNTTQSEAATTEKPQSQLLKLLQSRADARRRGVPYRRSRNRGKSRDGDPNDQKKKQQPESPAATDAAPQPVVSSSSTTVPVFQPQQVPVYVEKDGVLIILPNAQPVSTAPAPVYTADTAAPAPVYNPGAISVVPLTTTTITTTPQAFIGDIDPPQQHQVTSGTPQSFITDTDPPQQPQVTTSTPQSFVTHTDPPQRQTTTDPPHPFDYYDFIEETVYASPKTNKVKDPTSTVEQFQELHDGTYVILAKPASDAGPTDSPSPQQVTHESHQSAANKDENGVEVSVSYAVSTSVSEGKRRKR